MSWLNTLSKEEHDALMSFDAQIANLRSRRAILQDSGLKPKQLEKLDSEILILRMQRYKLQNAASQRVRRDHAEQKKKRRATQQAKRRSERKRAGEGLAAGGNCS